VEVDEDLVAAPAPGLAAAPNLVPAVAAAAGPAAALAHDPGPVARTPVLSPVARTPVPNLAAAPGLAAVMQENQKASHQPQTITRMEDLIVKTMTRRIITCNIQA